MHLKIVVEGLVYGFDARLYGMTDDICYTFGRFFDILKVERLVVAAKKVSLGEVLEAVCREEPASWFFLLEIDFDAWNFSSMILLTPSCSPQAVFCQIISVVSFSSE